MGTLIAFRPTAKKCAPKLCFVLQAEDGLRHQVPETYVILDYVRCPTPAHPNDDPDPHIHTNDEINQPNAIICSRENNTENVLRCSAAMALLSC